MSVVQEGLLSIAFQHSQLRNAHFQHVAHLQLIAKKHWLCAYDLRGNLHLDQYLQFGWLYDCSLFIDCYCGDMNYRANLAPTFPAYNPENSLNYSVASKNYNKYSYRNANQDQGAMGQVEFMLQNERKKFREVRERIEADLDNQRKRRIQFQNKLIRLKDEFSRKQVALSEAQFKVNNLLHHNQDITLQNDKLKHELARLEQLYGGKIHELQTQLNMETKNFEDTTHQYNEEFTKFKKEGQDYVESLTFEYERKIKNLQEKLKATELARRDLSIENKKFNDLLITNRLQFQEEIRDIKNRNRDQQVKKLQQLTRSFQTKLKNVQDGKDGLNRKIQELIRIVQDKESKLVELDRELNDQNARLRQEKVENVEQINQLNYLLSKARGELADKDGMMARSSSGNESELKLLKQQLQARKQENIQLQASLRDVKAALKDLEADSERKRRDLAQRCTYFEAEARKYKQEYARLAEMLKTKINSTIDNVSVPRK